MSWAEIKKSINSNLNVPLNEQIIEKPNGFQIHKSKKTSTDLLKRDSYNDYGTITLKDKIKKDGLLYVLDDTYTLKTIDITKNAKMTTLRALADSTYTTASLLLVTKTYIYGTVVSSVTKIFRYNKNTGEYKISTTTIPSEYNVNNSVFVSYEDDIFMYRANVGYYKVTDEIDSNGSFSFSLLNSNYANGYTSSNQSLYNCNYNSIRCEIELPNRTVLIAIGSRYDKRLILYKVNVDNGSWTVVKQCAQNSFSGYVLTPIKQNEKIVGVLFGLAEMTIMLYKIDSNNNLTLLEEYQTDSGGNTVIPDCSRILEYDNTTGKIYECESTNPRYIYDDINLLAEARVNSSYYVTYLPKGTKVNQDANAIYRIKTKLRDTLVFNNDNLIRVDNKISPDSNGIVTIDEDGYYMLEGYTSNHPFYYYGTIF